MTTTRPRILLLGDQLNPGGTEGQFVEIACGVDRSRWDLRVACLRANGALRGRLEAAGLPVRSCGRGSFRSPRFAGAVWNLARELRTQRIRLLHSFDFYSNILGLTAARLARVPAIIASQRELGDFRPKLHQKVHRVALRLAHYVLVNSAAVAEQLRGKRVIAPERIVLIPNGVDLRRFSRSAGRGPERPTIGTLAVLRPEKGLADFVRASALVRERVPAARFAIWGDGPHRQVLEAVAAEAGLDGALQFRGATVMPEVALRELDIFVLPSLSEACSNALLEAMATGLAVVATRVGGNVALVDDMTTGLLVPPGDATALAKAIIRLCEDPALAERLGAAAWNTVHARFSLDRMLSDVQALWARVLGARSRS